MILEILFCILSFGTCHEWRERPLGDNTGKFAGLKDFTSRSAGSVKSNWRHDQGFYQDGTNSGYFKDGVHSDSKENLDKYNYKPQSGEITRKPELMKEAERNVGKDFRADNYNAYETKEKGPYHNCHDYKEAVNKEYGELVKERGL